MKQQENRPSTILAIETAVGSGSISIVQDGIETRAIDGGMSRAEAVLVGIRKVLADCELTLREIDIIATSLGPGSFTGIRIGLATGLGLKRTLSVKLVGVNALEAMSLLLSNEPGVVVLPLGRGNYALQEFDLVSNPISGPSAVDEDGLIRFLGTRSNDRFIFHQDIDVPAAERLPRQDFVVSTEPLATLIGRWVFAGRGTEDGKPIYLRNREIAATDQRSP